MPHASTSHAVQAPDGVTLGGQYQLGRCLGSGGMGTVWQAQDCRLKRQVAIKFLDTQQLDAAGAEQRFQREAMLAASLHSPHVVQIFAQGCTSEGRPYIVMELLEGEDLRCLIAREGPLDPQLALSILEQVSVGLSHAHRQGLVHRDIKPPNIFLVPRRSDGVFVKLLDFGVAKDLHTPITKLTFTGAFIGTLFYISPEQLSDPQRVGPSADIWAAAVTAYEMLTGTMPFGAGAALPELLFKISKGAYTPATTANPSLPRAIDLVFEKAFRAKPEERFRSIGELCAALSRVFFSEEGLSPTLSSGEVPDHAERHEFPASNARLARRCVGLLALLTLLLGGMGAWWLRSPSLVRPRAQADVAATESPHALIALEAAPIDSDNVQSEPATERGMSPPEAAQAPVNADSTDTRSGTKPKLVAPSRTRATPPTASATAAPLRVVNYGF